MTSIEQQEAPLAVGRTRGRIGWAIAAVIVLVGMGAAVGWRSPEPQYQASGLVYFTPPTPPPTRLGDGSAMFQGYVAFNAEVLRSGRMASLAAQSSAWTRAGGTTGADAAAHVEAGRTIEHVPSTQHVRVVFTDRRADLAQAGVDALLEAYEDLAAEFSSAESALEVVRARQEHLAESQGKTMRELLPLVAEFGGVEALELTHRALMEEVFAITQKLNALRKLLQASDSDALKTPAEIAVESAPLAQALREIRLLEADEALMSQKHGANSDRLVALRSKIRVLATWITEFTMEWNAANIRQARSRADELVDREKVITERLRRLGGVRGQVARIQASIEADASALRQAEMLEQQLESQLMGRSRVSVVDTEPTAVPLTDLRRSRALLGGAIAAGLALLGFLLVRAVRRPAAARV